MAETSASKIVPIRNQDDARRSMNKANAVRLARAGIPTFPSNGKTPLVKLYNRKDTEIAPEDREAVIEQAREEGNRQLTVFVGATTDPDIVKRMWRAPNWDAVPSIACGPARLVVIDADTKFNGPELIGKLFDEHGGVPEGTQIITTQSGGRHYIFSDPDNAFTNSAGALKKQYGCDVRGRGGQFVAPGSIREDGKRYGDQATLKAFVDAYTNGEIPPLPDYIVELIGAPSSEAGEDIPVSKEREAIKQLDEAEVPEWEELCAPLGDYDFDKLQAENTEFKSLYSEPSADCSDNRFKAARHVMREWPEMPVEHLASFFSAWDGAGDFVDGKPRSGEYDNRQTAREWLKNQGLSKSSTGDAFGAVVDEDEEHTERTQGETKAGQWYENAISIPVDLDINRLPPRPYLYSKYLMRGHVTLLSAAGGIGKSAWTLDSAIDLACGVDHLGAGEFKPRKVLVYNGEDDQDEMLRRIGAQFEYHNFTPEMRAMVRENLTIISGVKASMRLADYKDGRVVLNEKAFKKLAELIEERGIDIVILDPLIALHSIPENANSEMNVVMTRFKNLAATKLIALLLAHHDKKNISSKSLEDATQDDARGAGTITTPVRVVLNMRRLSKRDAQTWHVPPEDAPHVIALSAGAKSNYSARDVVPKLFRAHSVLANNGTDEFASDSTVALAVYTPPKRPDGSGIGDEATLKVLAALDGDEPVGSDSRHTNWIGRVIADAAGWDVDAKHVRESIRDIIADWTARDWIAEAVLEASGKGAERRKSVKVYKRGASRPSPRVYAFDAVHDEDEAA